MSSIKIIYDDGADGTCCAMEPLENYCHNEKRILETGCADFLLMSGWRLGGETADFVHMDKNSE